jgi:hypothetical protein
MVVNRKGEVWSTEGIVGHSDSKQFLNSLGAEQSITTLTSILPGIIEQKFYVPGAGPADFVPVEVGQGNPFASELMNWSTGITGGDFEDGLINMSSNESHTGSDNIQIEPIKRSVVTWKRNVSYNVIQQGVFDAATQNMGYINALYSARKKEYDLGFQKCVFFGLKSNTSVKGLLTQSANSDVTTITKYFKDMTAAEFIAAVGKLIPAYQANCNYTAMPNTFVIPAIDFNGLTVPTSEVYPIAGSSRLEVMKRALEMATGGTVEIKSLAYADEVRNTEITGLGLNRYVLYNKVADSIICNVPLDFTVTLPGTANGFDYTSAAYSRFTGVQALRPLEMLYFDFTNPTT